MARGWRENLPLLLAVLCIVVYAVVGVVVMGSYGITWDEDAQLQVGRNHLAYLQTGDKELLQFGSNKALPHYGAAFPVAVQVVSRFTQDAFGLPLVDAQHVLIFLSGLSILIALFCIARRLFSDRVALFSVLFLAFFPRFFAHSFYNPKDIPIVAFITLTIMLVYRSLEQHSWKAAVMAGAVFGFGLASLVTTILGLPILLGLYLCYRLFQSDRQWRSMVREDALLITLFAITSALTTFLLWPTLWTDQLFFVDAVQFFLHHRWDGAVLYLGTMYTSTTLPWHYAPVFLGIVTPLFTLVAATVGGVVGVKESIAQKNRFQWFFLALWFFVPLVLFVKPGAVNYDGIRHFFIALPPLMIAAAVGLDRSIQWLNTKIHNSKFTIAVVCIFFAWLCIEMIRAHPFQGAYFNEPTRLMVSEIHETFETDYWAASYRQAVEWVEQKNTGSATICANRAQHLLRSYTAQSTRISVDCKQPDYTFVLTRGGSRTFSTDIHQDAQRIHTIANHGTQYVQIFAHTMQHHENEKK